VQRKIKHRQKIFASFVFDFFLVQLKFALRKSPRVFKVRNFGPQTFTALRRWKAITLDFNKLEIWVQMFFI